MNHQQKGGKSDKTERATYRTREEKMTGRKEPRTGLGRRTNQQMGKGNQMTALRLQAGGKHQTSPAFLRGLSMPSSVHATTDVKDRQYWDLGRADRTSDITKGQLSCNQHNMNIYEERRHDDEGDDDDSGHQQQQQQHQHHYHPLHVHFW